MNEPAGCAGLLQVRIRAFSVQFPPNQSFAGEKSIQEILSGDLLVCPNLQSFSRATRLPGSCIFVNELNRFNSTNTRMVLPR